MTKRKKKLVSEQLIKAIQASELTRYRIWKETGIAQSTLSEFVNGNRWLSLQNIDLVCELLDLELKPRKYRVEADLRPRSLRRASLSQRDPRAEMERYRLGRSPSFSRRRAGLGEDPLRHRESELFQLQKVATIEVDRADHSISETTFGLIKHRGG